MKKQPLKKSRYRRVRIALLFWSAFIGLSALGGSLAMFLDPSGLSTGMDVFIPYFQKLPFADILFQNLVFAGVSLFLFEGATNLWTVVALLLKRKEGPLLSLSFGLVLMAWCSLQFYLFPPNVLSTLFFLFGFAEALTGYMGFVFRRQEEFQKGLSPLPTDIKGKKNLVVYYSRMGYTREVAREEAKSLDADVLELETSERTEGTLGFWWCGRFGMHRWGMPLLPMGVDVRNYERVVIVSPIWVFHVASPVKTFLESEAKGIGALDLVLVHFMGARFKREAESLSTLYGLKLRRFRSVRCRFGKRKDLC